MAEFVVSGKDVRLAQKMQVGPCIPVGIQLLKAAVGPTSGPTWRLSHLVSWHGLHAPPGQFRQEVEGQPLVVLLPVRDAHKVVGGDRLAVELREGEVVAGELGLARR